MAAEPQSLPNWRWNQPGNDSSAVEHDGVCAVMANMVGRYCQQGKRSQGGQEQPFSPVLLSSRLEFGSICISRKMETMKMNAGPRTVRFPKAPAGLEFNREYSIPVILNDAASPREVDGDKDTLGISIQRVFDQLDNNSAQAGNGG